MFDFKAELEKYGLTEETYEACLKDASDKVQNLTDIDWQELVEKYQLPLHYDTLRKSQQPSPFGGAFIREYFLDKMSKQKNFDNDTYLAELKTQKQEILKEKQKLRDERTEFNKQIREQARNEHFEEMIKRVVCENVEPIEFDCSRVEFESDNDLLVSLSDIHTGIEINNIINQFDENILKQRLEKYTAKILSVAKTHNSQNCYLVISEALSGLIHNTLRIQNNLDLMEQFKYIASLISQMLKVLSEKFNKVCVYVAPGNHSRIMQNKSENLAGENMDILLPFYLQASMQNYVNVEIFDNALDKMIACFNIRGSNVFAVHGDKDNPSSVVQNFTMMFGVKPDILLMGHRHSNGLTTVYDAKVLEAGCCSGTDEYAMSIRKTNRPEQIIAVIGNDGLNCLYDIQLD